MPADLTEGPHHCNGERMQLLLEAIAQADAGVDAGTIAQKFLIPREEFQHAFETYHQAGRAALESASEEPWLQAHVAFADWEQADQIAATVLAPHLDRLCENGTARHWWFIRKYPHWRIRILAQSPEAKDELAERLTVLWKTLAAGDYVDSWRWTIYEPETAAFGGATGMDATHGLFAEDSRRILQHGAQTDEAIGDRETSIMLCTRLFLSAGLDWFEMGDVWQRVAALRPRPEDATHERIAALAGDLKPLLQLATRSRDDLFGPARPLHHLSAWADAYTQTGALLGNAAKAGDLERGIRAVLAHHVIFHWNRFGFSSERQALLAHAVKIAILDNE